jgi:DNA polymerase
MQDVNDIADDLTLLAWQVEMGADEAIADAPVDRFEVLPKKIESPEIRNAARTDPSMQYSAAPEVTDTRRKVVARPAAPANGAGVEAATSIAASCSTLEELKSAMEAFDGGLLKRSAKNTVFSDGVAGSDLMIVGEAPGADEDQMGKPFVGVSGQLLDKMLAAIGKNRTENAYISNIVPWRPLGNRTPDQAIITMCLPFIQRHIELAHPKVILLLGGVAAKSLLETEDGITRLRGKWRDLSFGEHKIAAMPTYHPAYLLRQPAQKGHAWRDLLAVKDKITSLS